MDGMTTILELEQKVKELEATIRNYIRAEDENLQIIKDKDASIAFWIQKATEKAAKIERGNV